MNSPGPIEIAKGHQWTMEGNGQTLVTLRCCEAQPMRRASTLLRNEVIGACPKGTIHSHVAKRTAVKSPCVVIDCP